MMNELLPLILAGGYYLLTKPQGVTITSPMQGQVITKRSFPSTITVSGKAAKPLTIHLFSGSVMVDEATVPAGTFSAVLEIEGPGPHEIKWTRQDSTGNTLVSIVSFGIKEESVTFPPVFDISKLVGANYLDPVLRRKEREASRPYNPAYALAELTDLKNKGHNFLRVVVYWEAMYPYAQNRENVLRQLEEIAAVAEDLGISLVIDNHHFHGSSAWKFIADNGATRAGGGFPSYIVQGYQTLQPYQTSVYINASVKQFFDDWYNDRVANHADVWGEFFSQFWQPIISRLDAYKSVIGYEILNELQYFDEPQIAQAGVFHTDIGGRMRTMTSKFIVFDEGNVRGNQINGAYARANQHLAAPQVGNIIYAPHTYGVGTQLDGHIADFKRTQSLLGGIPVFIGEHAPQDNNLNQTNMDYQLQSFKNAGFGSTYWAYAASEELGIGNNLRPDGKNGNTGTMYYAARKKVYGY